jgi:hypothetical protein
MPLITEKVSGLSVPRMSVTVQTAFIKCTVTCIESSGIESDTELGQVAELFGLALAGVGFQPEQIEQALNGGVK